jgi:GNAT superfamily N-acetyltransferase
MKDILTVRKASKEEMEWVNKCYDEVEFVHSFFEREVVAVAELGGHRAGIGRLVTIDSHHLELGGMYVFEPYRNRGVASAIINFLLKHSSKGSTVYCIPFGHLVSFYQGFGFIPCTDLKGVPKEVLDKCQRCKEKYCHPTSLLFLEK